jgi:hypothetical protein
MTRERKSDLISLNEFLSGYSIGKTLNNDKFQSDLRLIHKAYFSLLTWGAEMSHGANSVTSELPAISGPFEQRLNEAFSDIDSAVFNWVQGGYKAARVMIRSAIENFVRSVAGLEDSQLLSEKNVFSLFEKSSKLFIFNSIPSIQLYFKKLHSDYKVLCLDVHTAGVANMEKISSLAEFPRFDTLKSRHGAEIIIRVIKNLIASLCLIFNKFFHKMHHKNKENVLISIANNIKPVIHGIEIR